MQCVKLVETSGMTDKLENQFRKLNIEHQGLEEFTLFSKLPVKNRSEIWIVARPGL
jgi:hypothetical protein